MGDHINGDIDEAKAVLGFVGTEGMDPVVVGGGSGIEGISLDANSQVLMFGIETDGDASILGKATVDHVVILDDRACLF